MNIFCLSTANNFYVLNLGQYTQNTDCTTKQGDTGYQRPVMIVNLIGKSSTPLSKADILNALKHHLTQFDDVNIKHTCYSKSQTGNLILSPITSSSP